MNSDLLPIFVFRIIKNNIMNTKSKREKIKSAIVNELKKVTSFKERGKNFIEASKIYNISLETLSNILPEGLSDDCLEECTEVSMSGLFSLDIKSGDGFKSVNYTFNLDASIKYIVEDKEFLAKIKTPIIVMESN